MNFEVGSVGDTTLAKKDQFVSLSMFIFIMITCLDSTSINRIVLNLRKSE